MEASPEETEEAVWRGDGFSLSVLDEQYMTDTD